MASARTRCWQSAIGVIGVSCAGLWLCACSTGPRNQTTRLTADDVLVATDSIRETLASSRFLEGRDSNSPRWKLMLIPAENKSAERLSSVERLQLMTLVGIDAPVLELLASKNVDVCIADDTRESAQRLRVDLAALPRDAATHFMLADVRSITRQGGDGTGPSDVRTDLMSVQYRIVQAGSSAALWASQMQIKRAARGTVAD